VWKYADTELASGGQDLDNLRQVYASSELTLNNKIEACEVAAKNAGQQSLRNLQLAKDDHEDEMVKLRNEHRSLIASQQSTHEEELGRREQELKEDCKERSEILRADCDLEKDSLVEQMQTNVETAFVTARAECEIEKDVVVKLTENTWR
jgi:hypothetical protein